MDLTVVGGRLQWGIFHPANYEFFQEALGISHELEFVFNVGNCSYGSLGEALVGLRNFVESEIELDQSPVAASNELSFTV